MAQLEVLALDTGTTDQVRAPGASDSYIFPRVAQFLNGTAAAPGISFSNTASGFYSVNGADAYYTRAGSPMVVLGFNRAALASVSHFGLTSSLDPGGTVDAAFGRDSAGVGAITSGTAGAYRDLRLRSLIAEQVIQTKALTVATLPAAASWAGAEAYVTDASGPTIGSAVAGGGSARAVVRSNGTNWIVTSII